MKNNLEFPAGIESREFGRNIHAVLEFKRHATPGKTPEGMSADFLTEDGKQMAAGMGREVHELNLAGYSSPAMRAQETIDLLIDNTDDSIRVINKKHTEGGASNTGQRKDNEFRIKTRDELAPTAGFAKIMPLAKEYAEKQKKAGSIADTLTHIIQFYLDNPTICEELGVESPKESAAGIAYRVATEMKMTDRFYRDTNIRLVNVSHGPKLEPFLKEVIGFDRLEDIGGAVGEGEGFEFIVDIDEKGDKKTTLLFRGQTYIITEEQIETILNLSEIYRGKKK